MIRYIKISQDKIFLGKILNKVKCKFYFVFCYAIYYQLFNLKNDFFKNLLNIKNML